VAALLLDILQQGLNKGILPNKTVDAREWFRETASQANVRSPSTIIKQAPKEDLTLAPFIGKLILFQYQATTAGNLPYWDKFPIIFPFRLETSGFYGINLHYLPLDLRARLMDALYSLTSNNNYTPNTRLRLSYDILNSTSKFRFFKPCVKHYLNKGLRSPFVVVPPEQWDIALFLPLERFQSGTAGSMGTQTVHQAVRRQLKGK
jgi:hypothetical protein